jgi:hypothetical protein
MPWYRRKALWLATLALAAVLVRQFTGLSLSEEAQAALLTVIDALIQALAGAPLS